MADRIRRGRGDVRTIGGEPDVQAVGLVIDGGADCDPGFRLSADNVERAMALSYLRELRPGPRGARESRLLFAFDQGRTAVVLVAGTPEIDWTRSWYVDNVPLAHARYIQYLRERAEGGNA